MGGLWGRYLLDRPGRVLGRGFALSLSLLALLALAIGPGRADASRYLPDRSFGNRGVVDLVAGNGLDGTFREVRAVEPGPEGATFVLYTVRPGPGPYECEAPHALARYLPNGALDTGFGSGGYVSVVSPIECQYPTFSVDGRSRPLITWTTSGPSRALASVLAVTRLLPDGTPDYSFGVGGTAFLSIPCPPGSNVGALADRFDRVILSFGCGEGPEEGGTQQHSYLLRLGANGAIDTGYGSSGISALAVEPGWEYPRDPVVEADGSIVFFQTTDYLPGVPRRARLLRFRGGDGALGVGYVARTERTLAYLTSLGSRQPPEDPMSIVVRPGWGLALAGRSVAHRGGWVVAFRHDGSLDRDFGEDGYLRFETPLLQATSDSLQRLLLFGFERNRGLTIYRLDPDGNRDTTIGDRRGERLGVLRELTFREVVSIWKDRPLIYFDDSSSSCDSPQSCAEPAALLRLRPPQLKRLGGKPGR